MKRWLIQTNTTPETGGLLDFLHHLRCTRSLHMILLKLHLIVFEPEHYHPAHLHRPNEEKNCIRWRRPFASIYERFQTRDQMLSLLYCCSPTVVFCCWADCCSPTGFLFLLNKDRMSFVFLLIIKCVLFFAFVHIIIITYHCWLWSNDVHATS